MSDVADMTDIDALQKKVKDILWYIGKDDIRIHQEYVKGPGRLTKMVSNVLYQVFETQVAEIFKMLGTFKFLDTLGVERVAYHCN